MRKATRVYVLIILDLIFLIVALLLFLAAKRLDWFETIGDSPIGSAFIWSFIVVALVCILAFNIYQITRILKREKRISLENLVLDGEDADRFTAEKFKEIFEQAMLEKPALTRVLNDAIQQIDTFYEEAQNLEQLMELKEITYSVIYTTVETSEQLLMKNMKNLLSDIIVWRAPKGMESMSDLEASMQNKLQKNGENLETFHQLLMTVRALNGDEVEEDHALNALLQALRSTK